MNLFRPVIIITSVRAALNCRDTRILLTTIWVAILILFEPVQLPGVNRSNTEAASNVLAKCYVLLYKNFIQTFEQVL